MINQVCFHSCGISIILLVSDLDLELIDPVLERIGKAELATICAQLRRPCRRG